MVLVIRSTSQSIVHFPELGTIVAVADPRGGGGAKGAMAPPFQKLACLLFNYKQSSAGDLA